MLQADKGTARLLALADFLERMDPKHYNQEILSDGDECGCMAHWACVLYDAKRIDLYDASLALGIKIEDAGFLFHADAGKQWDVKGFVGITLRRPTPQEAAKCLREYAVTGEVPADWVRHVHL